MKNLIITLLAIQVFIISCSTYSAKENNDSDRKIKLKKNETYQLEVKSRIFNSHGDVLLEDSPKDTNSVKIYFKDKFNNYNIEPVGKCNKIINCIKVQIKVQRNCDRKCGNSAWAITLLSLGLIPTWFSGETEIDVSLGENKQLSIKSNYLFVMHLVLSPYLLFKTPIDSYNDEMRNSLDKMFESPNSN